MNINYELYQEYHKVDDASFQEVKEYNQEISIKKEKITAPLLLKVNDLYTNAKLKIMVFGQETNNWNERYDESDCIDDIISIYEDFYLSGECYKRKSPFWRFMKTFNERIINEVEPNSAIIWNNIVKMGKCGIGFPNEFYKPIVQKYYNDLIIKEVEIVKPDILIFLTGPNIYEQVISDVFKNPERKIVDNIDERLLNKINISSVKLALRTHHPKSLSLNKNTQFIQDKLIELIKKSNW